MKNEPRLRECYRIGSLTLDADAFRVEDAGREIPMPRLTFDLFAALVRRAPDVVTIDELMDAVWPNVVISEETVTQRVRLLREALGPQHRDMVSTVRGRGYRIAAPVKVAEPASPLADHSSRKRYGILAATLMLSVIAGSAWLIATRKDAITDKNERPTLESESGPSIAVLPFTNMSDDQTADYFSAGVAEELLSRLARLPHLRVASRTSSFALMEKGLDVRSIADRLDVRHILEGSVRRAGNRVRVTAKLIDVDSDTYVMTESFERELDDIFAVQDEIAGTVASALTGKIETSNATATLQSKRLTRDLHAYELYLEGKYQLHLRGLEPVARSIALLAQAVERDPQFADAHAVLASAYATIPFYSNEETNHYVPLMESSAQTALSLDDSIALAEGVLASVESIHRWELIPAEARFRRAIALEPNNSYVWQWYAEFFLRTGHFEDARDAAREAVRLDPVGSSVVNVLGLTHHYLGENDKALEYAARAREFGRLGGYLSALVYEQRGDYDRAIAAWEDAAPQMGLDTYWIRPYIGALSNPAQRQTALRAINKAHDDGQRTVSGFASEYAALNEIGMAFEIIEREIASKLFYLPILWEPRNKALRQDPRFSDLLRRLHIVEYWEHRGWPAHCEPLGDNLRCD